MAGPRDTSLPATSELDELSSDSSSPLHGMPVDEAELAAAQARVFDALMAEDAGASLARVGRFTLIERLGTGGMGVVWAAFDPDLDRRIALKLVRPDREKLRPRLVREAQAMATLSHPNVATIYEVGTHERDVYLAMELVRGETLAAWTRARSRTWSEILAVYLQAARGLAAAHDAGIVHRDFKPDNAILGSDARVRVVDFGLARREDAAILTTSDDDERGARERAAERTGSSAAMGTPGYAAPEQIRGEATDARSDQFALCVSLWEALFDERPFDDATYAASALETTALATREPSARRRAPGFVADILRRGLSARPDARFPSMHALVTALERCRLRARIRRAAIGIGVLTAILTLFALGSALRRSAAIAACEARGDEIDEVWNASARSDLRDAMLATGIDHAPQTIEKLVPWLDRWTREWRESRTEACLEADVRETWDPETRDHVEWCLEESKLHLAALVAGLSSGGANGVNYGIQSALALVPASTCLDASSLARMPVPPLEKRIEVTEIRAQELRAGVMSGMSTNDEAVEAARAALARARELDWPPMTARAHYRLGAALAAKGPWADAEPVLEAAFFEAARAGATDVAAASAEALVDLVGSHLSRPRDGRRWSRLAELVATELPDPSGLRAAKRLQALGQLAHDAGEYEEAQSIRTEVLTMRTEALGGTHPLVAFSLTELAITRLFQGAYDEARTSAERALAIDEDAFGPHHPRVATAVDVLGAVAQRKGEYESSRALHERALTILENAFGPNDAQVARARNHLGNTYYYMGDFRRAVLEYERALAIMETHGGAEHPEVAIFVHALGNAYARLGDFDGATRCFTRALAIDEKLLGPEHPTVGSHVFGLAGLRSAVGDYRGARELYQRAFAIEEKALGPDHPTVANTLTVLGITSRELGDVAEAKAMHERALAIRRNALGSAHPDVADSLEALAGDLIAADELDAAESALSEALRIAEAVSVPDAIQLARLHDNLGFLQLQLGRLDQARHWFERSLEIKEKALGERHHYVFHSLSGLATVALGQGRKADAIELAERALTLDHTVLPEESLAELRFVLARATWSSKIATHEPARRLAELARKGYAATAASRGAQIAEIERWLATHR